MGNAYICSTQVQYVPVSNKMNEHEQRIVFYLRPVTNGVIFMRHIKLMTKTPYITNKYGKFN